MASAVGIKVEEHFHNAEQQRETAKLGMWVFLLTELLLFSGMFVSALVIRVLHPDSVTAVALHLKFWIGATNTAVLIVSSFCMSGAIESSRLGLRRPMIFCMLATAGLGVLFLMLKGYEYYRDYVEHMTPFLSFRRYELVGDPASRLFTDLYFIITGLHAVHLTIGIVHHAGHVVAGQPPALPGAPPEPHRDHWPVLALHRSDLDDRVSDLVPAEQVIACRPS